MLGMGRGQGGGVASRPEGSECPSHAKSWRKESTGRWQAQAMAGRPLAGSRNSTRWAGGRRVSEGQQSGRRVEHLRGQSWARGPARGRFTLQPKGSHRQVWRRESWYSGDRGTGEVT